MSVLVIRAHKRFAVCSQVRLRKDGRRGSDGLLIELSLDGCRISHVKADSRFALGDHLTIRLDGTDPIKTQVRWVGEGAVGLRFDRPLHNAGLEQLIRLCRGGTAPAQRAYGT